MNEFEVNEFEWRRWAAENLMLEVPVRTIRDILDKNGIECLASESALNEMSRSAEVTAGRRLVSAARKLDALLGVLDAVRVTELGTLPVETAVSPEKFFGRYYTANLPVVLSGFGSASAAVRRWSFESLSAVFRNCDVEVMMDRDADPAYELRADEHRSRIPFDEFVAAVLRNEHSNNIYLVANNRLLDRPEATPLWADLPTGPGILDVSCGQGHSFLWIGPAGTVTPLHYDKMNILLVQIVGRKRIRLIPSTEAPRLYNECGVFSPIDLDAPDLERFPRLANVHVYDLTIGPGDAILIPVGWWHHVASLDASISVSFTNFAAPNEYLWDPV